MRKLASVQKILSLDPIPGADAIEKATVLGWELVVKKGEFRVGDLVVYCEVDSVLPERAEFEFLRDRKFRIKTIRLRGQISQGICFPLDVLPKDSKYFAPGIGWFVPEGTDVTEVLGVKKWEPYQETHAPGNRKSGPKYIFPNWMPLFVRQLMRRFFGGYCNKHYTVGTTFPAFIPKTDETRVQVLQDLLNLYEGIPCYVTEKVDGSSVTYYLNKGKFGVCSRNIDLTHDKDNKYWKWAIDNDLERKMRKVGEGEWNFAIQGELLGAGIQGNKYNLGLECLFFNVYDIDDQRYLDLYEFGCVTRELGVTPVPEIMRGFNLIKDIPELVNRAKIKSSLNPGIWAEGIVIRPMDEIVDRSGISGLVRNRVSFKVINPEFLLKYGE